MLDNRRHICRHVILSPSVSRCTDRHKNGKYGALSPLPTAGYNTIRILSQESGICPYSYRVMCCLKAARKNNQKHQSGKIK